MTTHTERGGPADVQPTIYELLRLAAEADPGLSPDELADKMLADSDVPEPWRALFRPLVVWAAGRVLRRMVRLEERRHLRRPVRPSRGSAGPEEWSFSLDGYEGIAQQWLQMPDGRRVKWGEATIADHSLRVSWLEKHIATTSTTLDRHRTLVTELRVAGVDTLFELIAKRRKSGAA